MRPFISPLAAFAAATLLASCGGGSAGPNAVPVSPQSAAAAGSQTLLRLRIPSATLGAAAAMRNPQYVSRSTQGLGISYGSSPATFPPASTPMIAADVSASSPACVSNPTDGSRSCSIVVPAPPGNDDFQVKAWDAVPVGGSFSSAHLLSGTTVLARAIAAGQQNTLSFTLDGTVSSIFVAVAPGSLTLGTAATATVSVNATDYKGDIIMGTGGYADASGSPITVTLTQTAVSPGTLATAFVNQTPALGPITVTPATGAITVNYSGASGTNGTTFTATTSAPIAGLNTPGVLSIK